MVKTRLGLFSGVFLLVVGTAHSWPQRAVAVCIEPPEFSLCFDGFLNSPIGSTAILAIDVNGNLEVSGLQFTPPPRAVGTMCEAPGSGDKITPDDEDEAGNQGYSVHLDDTEIPADTTAYFVELEAYWGISGNDWNTGAIPIGFTHRGSPDSDITLCADFDVSPIGCPNVLVEFKAGNDLGTVKCPKGTVLTVPDNPGLILQRIVAHGTCPGNSCDGDNEDECEARKKTMLEFQFKDHLDITVAGGCTNPDGSSLGGDFSYSAKFILIQPDLATCTESCPSGDRAIDAPVSRGGNTPPIRSISLLGAEKTGRNGARADGGFVITREFLGDIPTVGTWGLVVMVQLVLVAGTVVFRRRLPIFS